MCNNKNGTNSKERNEDRSMVMMMIPTRDDAGNCA